MPLPPLNRRVVLALAGTALAAAVSACATPVPLSPEARVAPIRTIRVTGTANRTLATLAPMVAEELATLLGPRYAPGGRGGATLVVELTGDVIDDSSNGGSRHFHTHAGSATDQLEGTVALVGPRGEAYANFPLLAGTGATFRNVLDFYPDPRRLQSLAHAFAYWIVNKLG